MPTLHLLGTGAALSDAGRTTTMLAFQAENSAIVVDCGGDVVHRLLAADVPLDHIEALIVTHEHPDHVAGFPLFMEKIWLAQRKHPIAVYGPAAAIAQAQRCFDAFEAGGWKDVPQIEWHEVPLEQGAEVLTTDRWRITAAPGDHSVPVIGIRVEDVHGGGSVVYSADTEPTDGIVQLARAATILVHEATGEFAGHSTMWDAAKAAAAAEVERLILVHLPPGAGGAELQTARQQFANMELGSDGQHIEF